MDGNSLGIGWQDIRHLGYKNWEEYEQLENEEGGEEDGERHQQKGRNRIS